MDKDQPSLSGERSRLGYLDNLRFSLTILVICHHCNAAYGSIGGWSYIVHERGGVVSELLATMFAGITQAFFMSSFFLLSAYFTAPGYDAIGPWVYARRRLVRLGIPLVVYYYVLSVVLGFFIYRFKGRGDMGFVDFFSTHFGVITSPGPLWFAAALLVFESIYLLYRLAADRLAPCARAYPLPSDGQIITFILGIGLFTFFFRQWQPLWNAFWHFNLGYFPLYVAMFLCGVMAYRSGWFEKLSAPQANRWFRIALGAMALMPVMLLVNNILGHDAYVFLGGFNWQCFTYAMWEPFLCVGVNMKLIVFYRDHLHGGNWLTKHLAKSAYTAYIFHAFFIVFATYAFTFFSLGRIPEIVLMWPVAVIPCFLFAGILRQVPLLRRVLT
jgi:hypothetical protein